MGSGLGLGLRFEPKSAGSSSKAGRAAWANQTGFSDWDWGWEGLDPDLDLEFRPKWAEWSGGDSGIRIGIYVQGDGGIGRTHRMTSVLLLYV